MVDSTIVVNINSCYSTTIIGRQKILCHWSQSIFKNICYTHLCWCMTFASGMSKQLPLSRLFSCCPLSPSIARTPVILFLKLHSPCLPADTTTTYKIFGVIIFPWNFKLNCIAAFVLCCSRSVCCQSHSIASLNRVEVCGIGSLMRSVRREVRPRSQLQCLPLPIWRAYGTQ